MRKKIERLVLFMNYSCNNNCVFCINGERDRAIYKKTNILKQDMLEGKKKGATYLELIGGEVTIRGDILELVSFAKSIGFKTISITTNGRMMAYPDFAEKIVAAGMTDVVFSLHGPTAKVHDALTRSVGSFDQLMKGLENVKKLGLKSIGTNTTIVKQNFKLLPKIGELIYVLGIRNAEFIFVDPNIGGARKDFKKLVPTISSISPYVKKCLDLGSNGKSKHWHIRYMPLCNFSNYLNQISEVDERENFNTAHVAPDFKNNSVETSRAEAGKIKIATCKKCDLNDICEGVWKEYAKNVGTEELIAVKKDCVKK